MIDIDNIKKDFSAALELTVNVNDLQLLYTKYMSRKGILAIAYKVLPTIDIEKRKIIGFKLNSLKKYIAAQLHEKKFTLAAAGISPSVSVVQDLTISPMGTVGSLHPISLVIEKAINFFISLGFNIIDTSTEIETIFHNFDALNIHTSHPSRSLSDSFYLTNMPNHVLRTHTSGSQIPLLSFPELPIKSITLGPVYRRDNDSTHSPMFHQLDGLVVDTSVNLAHLLNIIDTFIHYMLGDNIQIRYRHSYFPFTEPSIEVDIQTSSNSNWLEVIGCGMLHRKVLDHMPIHTRQDYKGLAFGMGIDRLVMLYYNLNDLKTLFQNDLRFLNQFIGY